MHYKSYSWCWKSLICKLATSLQVEHEYHLNCRTSLNTKLAASCNEFSHHSLSTPWQYQKHQIIVEGTVKEYCIILNFLRGIPLQPYALSPDLPFIQTSTLHEPSLSSNSKVLILGNFDQFTHELFINRKLPEVTYHKFAVV